MNGLKSKFLSIIPHYSSIIQKRSVFWKLGKKKEENTYMVVRAKNDDHAEILDMLWKHYYPAEPTTLALGLGCKYNPVLDDHAAKDLAEGLTLVAKCKYTGDIVGACINRTACPWDPDLTDKFACSLCCPKTRQLLQFYAYVQRLPCLWERYQATKVFELSQLFVRRDDRGRGVATLLVQASRRLGADCGYRVVRLDATNYYSGLICEKLKMYMACEIPYCSYVGQGQEQVFNPPRPHTACKIYIDVPVYE